MTRETITIGLVVSALNVGGMETALLQLAEALRSRGCRISFVVTEHIGLWHDLPLKHGFKVITVLPKLYQSRRQHVRRIAGILDDFDACLLSHARFAQCSLGLLSKSTRTAVILHNLDAQIFHVGLSNSGNIDAVVAVGEAVRVEATHYCPATVPIRYIPNGIKLPPPVSRAVKQTGEIIKLAYLGRIEHKQKGVLYLPEIVAGLLKEGHNISLEVIGDGPDFPLLSRKLSNLLPASSLRLYGALEPDCAMQLLKSADVLLLPSHYEGQGLVLVEAMARGVVPVASRLTGITDLVIEDQHSGILVDVGKIEGFVEAIAGLSYEPDKLTRLSVGAVTRAHNLFDVNLMAERYLALLEEIRALPVRRTGQLDNSLLGRASFLPEGIRSMAVYIMKVMWRR